MNNDKNSIYKYKYIKYKNKFLKLKSQLGGNLIDLINTNSLDNHKDKDNNENNGTLESLLETVKEQTMVTKTECDTDCLINKLDLIQNDANDIYKVYDQEESIKPKIDQSNEQN